MSSIGGDDLLTHIETKIDPKLCQYLRNFVVPAIQNLGTNLGASPNGYVAPPDAPQGLIVNQQGPENAQFTIQHTSIGRLLGLGLGARYRSVRPPVHAG